MTEEKKKRRSFEEQLRITDRTSCEQAIRNGGVAALVVAGLTAIAAIAGFFVDTSNERLSSALDPWALVDVVLILVLAVFIFRKSRVASTLMLAYYVVSKLLQVMDGSVGFGLVVAVFFVLWFVTAMRGTYLWHSKYRHETSAPEVAS
jgi:hypothetical protein